MSRHILPFSLFESHLNENLDLEDQMEFVNHYTSFSYDGEPTWEYDDSSGVFNIDGDFKCHDERLTDFQGVRFGKVGGNFYCYDNRIKSLDGSPQEVDGDFWCSSNKLTSLAGGPEKVGGTFDCSDNPLISLEGAPKEIGEYFTSSYFELAGSQWNPKGYMSILKNGSNLNYGKFSDFSNKARKLVLSLISADEINKEIQNDPAGMIMALKQIVNDPAFKGITDKLVWPKEYTDEVDLAGDFGRIGL